MQYTQVTHTNERDPLNAVLFVFTHSLQLSAFILVIVIVNLGAQRVFDWRSEYVSSVLAFSCIAVCIPLVAHFLYRKTCTLFQVVEQMADMPDGQVQGWFQGQIVSVFGDRWTLVVSAMLAVAGTLTTEWAGVPWSGLTHILYLVFSATLFAMTGAVAWTYLRLLAFLSRLGSLKIKGTPFEWPQKEFRYLNSAYLKMFAAGVALYIGFVVAVWISPGGQRLALDSPLSTLWIFPLAGMVVGFFLAQQYLQHRIMASSKQRRLEVMNGVLASMFNEWIATSSNEKATAINDLHSWRDRIREEMDWPLDFKSTLAVVAGLLLPTIKSVIELITQG